MAMNTPDNITVMTCLPYEVHEAGRKTDILTVVAVSDENGDLDVEVGKGAEVMVVRDGAGNGHCTVAGEGFGHARRQGTGRGDAVRRGSGNGDAERYGEGDGDASRSGKGRGEASRRGAGHGDARRSGSGDGYAFRRGAGAGDAIRYGSGHGDADRSGSGTGDAHRHGNGGGDAVRSGAGAGHAVRTGSGEGAADRVGEGAGGSFTTPWNSLTSWVQFVRRLVAEDYRKAAAAGTGDFGRPGQAAETAERYARRAQDLIDDFDTEEERRESMARVLGSAPALGTEIPIFEGEAGESTLREAIEQAVGQRLYAAALGEVKTQFAIAYQQKGEPAETLAEMRQAVSSRSRGSVDHFLAVFQHCANDMDVEFEATATAEKAARDYLGEVDLGGGRLENLFAHERDLWGYAAEGKTLHEQMHNALWTDLSEAICKEIWAEIGESHEHALPAPGAA